MNKLSFLTQIGMIAIAVAIVIMYIEPKISVIRETQDLTTSYEVETENVSQVNESLRAKISTIDSIPPDDLLALSRFVPSTIDEISILKDLGIMIETQLIPEYDIAYKGNNSDRVSVEEEPNEYGPVFEHYFSVSFESDYPQLKALLAQLQINDYLLQVDNLKITESKDDLIKVDMSLTSFTLASNKEEII
jgi:hypothetical protein